MHALAQSCPTLCDPMVALQAPLSLEFSRQESWRGLPFPPPGDLPDPRIKPVTPVLASRFFTTGTTWNAWKWALRWILSQHPSPGHFLRAGVFDRPVGLLNTKRPEGLVLSWCYRKWPQEAAFPNALLWLPGKPEVGESHVAGLWIPAERATMNTQGLMTNYLNSNFILGRIVGLITFRYICVDAGGIISFTFYALVAQLCLALCDPTDCSPPGSSVRGIFQAKMLEWVAISFSRGSSPT